MKMLWRQEMERLFAIWAVAVVLVGWRSLPVVAQARQTDDALRAQREATEKELESIAIIDRKVMVPMRDGKRMQADIYRPKDQSKKYPIIFSRTPYNFNYWDIQLGAPRDMKGELDAVRRGYAYVEMNERGRYFSEGDHDILGPPLSDSDDELNWMSSQSWSNGKVGLIGCSSTAEWQLAVAARGNKALATFIPMGFGAGVGRVAPYYEQGNWFRGGAVQLLFMMWLRDYGFQTGVRPMFPAETTQQDLITAARFYDLNPRASPVDWSKAVWYLPEKDILKSVDAGNGMFESVIPGVTGGNMIARTPNDPAWYKGGLWNDSMTINVPGLWFMSWYDVSVGPNLAAYNFVRKTAQPDVANEQYAVIAPTLHCGYKRAEANTVVGERDMGDARLDYDSLTYGWFDYFLKGEQNGILEKTPRVRYYTMGSNKWQTSDTWPPAGATPFTYYFASAGKANTMYGDGVLTTKPLSKDQPDEFVYDPKNPVPTYGGGFCCMGPSFKPGALDQRPIEARNDILVYTTEPLQQGLEVSGPIDVTLYVSSDTKDTDFTIKVIDVLPDDTAYNIADNIQRVRYRDGYDKPLVWMEKGKVYKVTLQPMQISNYFAPGHKLRVEVSSSNFPRFDRNLNTGGHNYDETAGVVAHNEVHHSQQYPSSITVSVVNH
jgi:uncharacterized protein